MEFGAYNESASLISLLALEMGIIVWVILFI